MGQLYCSMRVTIGTDEHEDHPISTCQYEIQKEMEDPVAFTASTHP